jgi:hypothetical protein
LESTQNVVPDVIKPNRIASPEIVSSMDRSADLINPLDRPSSPELQNPFSDSEAMEVESSHVPEPVLESEAMHEDLESIPLSRTSSHTLIFHGDDDSMSDWTEAFDNRSETEGGSDVDSDSDVISDAESEASWARVRSRGVGYN